MRIIIIEDEQFAAESLAETIVEAEPGAKIVAILQSVKEAVAWFRKNDTPDLVFSDIQLGDGLSFEIFKSIQVNAPFIFCTAYDEYALSAFKANGIDYILKPFTTENILAALERYRALQQSFSRQQVQYESIIELFENRKTQKATSVLVHYKDKILPVKLNEIALFYIENNVTHLLTFDQKTYCVNKTLEELELLTGNDYFRTNRQCLINRKAVKDASRYFSRKLTVNITIPFKEAITISKVKVPEFLDWLSGG